MGNQPERSWIVCEFEVDRQQEDLAAWVMIHQLGANGCQVIEADGSRLTIQATFEPVLLDAGELHTFMAVLDEYGLGEIAGSLRLRRIEEEDWLAEWKKGFQPVEIGDSFLVCPPWLEGSLTIEQRRARRVILIEPGLAFGTGFHATTRFCLRRLERAAKPRRILDVGTGSGILAIGAAHIWADADIRALEVDPVACRVARDNFRLNGMAHRIRLLEGSTELVTDGDFDLILSNLTCEDNVALVPEYERLAVREGSMLILAGILASKLPRLREALLPSLFETTEEELDGDWAGVIATRRHGVRPG